MPISAHFHIFNRASVYPVAYQTLLILYHACVPLLEIVLNTFYAYPWG